MPSSPSQTSSSDSVELSTPTSVPRLGVGLTYHTVLAPLAGGGLIDFLEVEPETLWLQREPGVPAFRLDAEAVDDIRSLELPVVFHGIGFPIGGSLPPDPRHLPALRQSIDLLAPLWMSEHLSFNTTTDTSGKVYQTGFLLPPLQSAAGVQAALCSIEALAAALPIPFAIENGANYLRPRVGDLDDAEFLSRILDGSGCSLLLDLHNLWTNAINGRQSVESFIERIPLDRVIELHFAGGMSRGGYWLDAHCGATPEGVIELAVELIPRLSNLRAIVFEVFPSYIPAVGIDGIAQQLAILQDLWTLAPRRPAQEFPARVPARPLARHELAEVTTWEQTLGEIVIAPPSHDDGSEEPGHRVYQDLLVDFRGSMLTRGLSRTMRLLLLSMARDQLDALLHTFWTRTPPELSSAAEALRFGRFVLDLEMPIPLLDGVVRYDLAVLRAITEDRDQIVELAWDPLPVFRQLANGHLPEDTPIGQFEIVITAPSTPSPT